MTVIPMNLLFPFVRLLKVLAFHLFYFVVIFGNVQGLISYRSIIIAITGVQPNCGTNHIHVHVCSCDYLSDKDVLIWRTNFSMK